MTSENRTIDIADLSAGDNDLRLMSTDSAQYAVHVTVSGLAGALANMDLLESGNGSAWFEIGSTTIAAPGAGEHQASTAAGLTLLFAGIRIDKGTATAGTIVINAVSK